MAAPVYVVGPRWRHHAGHSGYEQFARHVGVRLAPVEDAAVSSGRETRLTAEAVGEHMREHPGATYHAVDGDRDLKLLAPHVRTDHRLLVSFHNPPAELEKFGFSELVEAHVHGAILVSESQREWFADLLPSDRVVVVPHGVDTGFFSPAPGAGEGLLTVGEHLRDFATLEGALRLLWAERPDVELTAAGAAPGWVEQLAGEERVTAVERLDDEALRDAYRRARAVVFPFLDATANNAVLEALACGAPVVATDVGGVAEYLEDGAALLCPPGDPAALAAALARVLDEDDLASSLSAAARARALEHDYAVVARAMASVYERVAG